MIHLNHGSNKQQFTQEKQYFQNKPIACNI